MTESIAKVASTIKNELAILDGLHVRELGNNPQMSDILIIRFDSHNSDVGKYAMFLDCAWRLERGDDVLAGSADVKSSSSGTRCLIGQALKCFDLSMPGLDLAMTFTDRIILRLFNNRNDPSEEADEFTHWRLYGPQGYYFGVGPGATYTLKTKTKGRDHE